MAASTVSGAVSPIFRIHNDGHMETKKRIASCPTQTPCFSMYCSGWSQLCIQQRRGRHSSGLLVVASTSPPSLSKTKLFVSGLSFRTSEESLRNAFQNFGQLVEVNLVMDKIANRSRGFAFIRYATEEESQNAIDGMHGKFLDGRVIFVEVAKSRSEMRSLKQSQ